MNRIDWTVGPQITTAEIDTQLLLSKTFDAPAAQIAALTTEQKRAISAQALDACGRKNITFERNAAVKNGSISASDAEAVRAAYWSQQKQGPRLVAVIAGGMSKDRADKALGTFTAMERGVTWMAIDRLIDDLRTIQLCMNGGTMPAPAKGVH